MANTKKDPTIKFYISLDKRIHDKLEQYATEKGSRVSTTVRKIIIEFINNIDSKKYK